MTKIEEMQEFPEKVIKMFDAVCEMLSENADINNMKVADITNRAGIGKGTAYEYFASKEEIITKALLYDTTKQFLYVSEVIRECKTFREKVMAGFDWIADNFKECKTFAQLVKIGMGTYDVSHALQDEFAKIHTSDGCDVALRVVDEMMQCGIEEGLLKPKNQNLMRMEFCSQVLMFAMFLTDRQRQSGDALQVEEVKNFAYEALVKMFQN